MTPEERAALEAELAALDAKEKGVAFTPTPGVNVPTPENQKLMDELAALDAKEKGVAPAPAVGPAAEKFFTEAQTQAGEQARSDEWGLIQEHEAKPDWWFMPEMSMFSGPGLGTTLATLATNPQDLQKIMESRGIKARKEGRYLLLTSPKNGQEYVFNEGRVQGSDIVRALTAGAIGAGALAALGAVPAVAAAGPASGLGMRLLANLAGRNIGSGLGTKVAAGMLGSGAGALVNEGVEELAGGDAEAAPVIASTLMGAAAPIVTATGRAAGNFMRGAGGPAPAPALAQEIGPLLGQAAEGVEGAGAEVGKRLAPDPKAAAAIGAMGWDDLVPVEDVAKDRVAQATVKSMKSQAGLVADDTAYDELKKRGRQVIPDLGGSTDRSAVSRESLDMLAAQGKDLKALEKPLYQGLKDETRGKRMLAGSSARAFLEAKKRELKGLFPADLQRALDALTPEVRPIKEGPRLPVLRSVVDTLRKQWGRAGRFDATFSDEGTGLAKTLYERLSDDLQADAEKRGVGFASRLKEAFGYTQQRKRIEEGVTRIAGKQLGEEVAGDIMPGFVKSVTDLSKGVVQPFLDNMKAIESLPRAQRIKVVTSSLAGAFKSVSDDQPFSFKGFADWWGALKGQKEAYNALVHNLAPGARHVLENLYTASRAISKANAYRSGGKVVGADPLVSANEVASVLAQGVVPRGGLGGLLAKVISGSLEPASQDRAYRIAAYLATPEFRAHAQGRAIAQATGKVPEGIVRKIMNAADSKWKRLMRATGVPESDWVPRLRETMSTEVRREVQQKTGGSQAPAKEEE